VIVLKFCTYKFNTTNDHAKRLFAAFGTTSFVLRRSWVRVSAWKLAVVTGDFHVSPHFLQVNAGWYLKTDHSLFQFFPSAFYKHKVITTQHVQAKIR
jgi:hypothetical protein